MEPITFNRHFLGVRRRCSAVDGPTIWAFSTAAVQAAITRALSLMLMLLSLARRPF
jgi:hypothetical protein